MEVPTNHPKDHKQYHDELQLQERPSLNGRSQHGTDRSRYPLLSLNKTWQRKASSEAGQVSYARGDARESMLTDARMIQPFGASRAPRYGLDRGVADIDDAISFLVRDHDKLRRLLSELVHAPSSQSKARVDLARQIRQELEVHAQLEEEVLYPAFRAAGQGKGDERLYIEAVEGHQVVAELVVPDLIVTSVQSAKFVGRARILRDLVEHHIEREESRMFERARKLMDQEQLYRLGEQLKELKGELLHAFT